MGRFVVVVLDSFGVGAMDDVALVRPQDVGANTCKHIMQKVSELRLPTLCQLGLMNALGEEIGENHFSSTAVYGVAELMHIGADSFYGHQEIMGTLPQEPLLQPFRDVKEEVAAALTRAGYRVSLVGVGEQTQLVAVNDSAVVGDNLETDLGQVYNVSGCLDAMSYEEIVQIGRVVRSVVKVSRVIAFGGEGVSFEQLMEAKSSKADGLYTGIDTPKSGLYEQGYRVTHLGYGVDPSVQVPTLLGLKGIEVSFIGKVGDIVDNREGRAFPGVETEALFEECLNEVQRIGHGFICLNIQETDLAGHAENAERYADRLQVSDRYLGKLLMMLHGDDLLIVTADHGNDPTIGHSHHTRERVPILIYKEGVQGIKLGCLPTLSDIGASVADYFRVERPENGHSFLTKLLN
ncbi:phosphopentomutase [Paenibacillus pectinilyticus]|uniref:Phosphopentomutase n=1 Tax=Paenibacillus pectinilyticus TaxID=512399 RepID=A0A1C1A6X3_9BACL|nr:phosphopentomutase [Paenibacillus pectinilyticus]OCT16310.1 phosphopentomutase [Paenibacillus pectinilyticus]